MNNAIESTVFDVIDNTTGSIYNDNAVRLIAEEAAGRAVAKMISLFSQPGQAYLENCNEQEIVCSDESGGLIMSPRVKAKINLNGQDVWFSASSVQQDVCCKG